MGALPSIEFRRCEHEDCPEIVSGRTRFCEAHNAPWKRGIKSEPARTWRSGIVGERAEASDAGEGRTAPRHGMRRITPGMVAEVMAMVAAGERPFTAARVVADRIGVSPFRVYARAGKRAAVIVARARGEAA